MAPAGGDERHCNPPEDHDLTFQLKGFVVGFVSNHHFFSLNSAFLCPAVVCLSCVHCEIYFKLHFVHNMTESTVWLYLCVVKYSSLIFPVCLLTCSIHIYCWLLWRTLINISVVGAFCVIQLNSHSPNFSTTPRCGTKPPPRPPRRSEERSHTIQAGLLDSPGVSGDGLMF